MVMCVSAQLATNSNLQAQSHYWHPDWGALDLHVANIELKLT